MDDQLLIPARHSFAPLQKSRQNHRFYVCTEGKPCPVWFSCRRKSCDPYDSVNRLSYRKCGHQWSTGIFSSPGEWGQRTTNRCLYRTFIIFKLHGHDLLPSNLPFIDGIFKTQLTGKWNSREETICIQLYLLQFYILSFHVRIFTLEIREAGT